MEEVDQNKTESSEIADELNGLNDYEKVILAAKLARKINETRIAAGEQLSAEELAKMDRRKVTTAALEDLEKGKVKISHLEEEPAEETYDLT
jgi:DNA-directed RNA polymerase omega subunit